MVVAALLGERHVDTGPCEIVDELTGGLEIGGRGQHGGRRPLQAGQDTPGLRQRGPRRLGDVGHRIACRDGLLVGYPVGRLGPDRDHRQRVPR